MRDVWRSKDCYFSPILELFFSKPLVVSMHKFILAHRPLLLVKCILQSILPSVPNLNEENLFFHVEFNTPFNVEGCLLFHKKPAGIFA